MSDATRMGRVAVTGAGGFLGSALVHSLIHEVDALRGLLGPSDRSPILARPGLQYLRADIEDPTNLERLTADAEVVFHLAGIASVADSFRRPAEHFRVHTRGTTALLSSCRGIRRLVYVSSAEVYGEPEHNPVDELHPVSPRSPYGAAKLATEQALESWAEEQGIEVVILRLFSVFGPRPDDPSVVGDLLRQALHEDALRPFTLSPVRGYCFIDDVVTAMRAAATSPLAEPFRVFNIGASPGVSVGELAIAVLQAVGRQAPILVRGDSDRPPRTDIQRLVADTTRAGKDLGWQAHTGLLDGLRRILEHSIGRSNVG